MNSDNHIKLIIGFITYGKSTAKYLPYFLSNLKKQTFTDFKIIAFDNTENSDNENINYIKNSYPEIKILGTGKNIGFARAYNKMISRAVEMDAKYFLAINNDIILEPDAIKKMANAMDSDKELDSVCPKILKWDFEQNKKTKIIDSCGIQEISALRFKDIGQGEIDRGQYDGAEILGPSGAAAIYRVSVLEEIKNNSEYFDELMFMYEEDCDLAYRLKLAGYKSKLISKAVIYHDRTASAKGFKNLQVALNRKNKSQQIKRWGFLHKHIIFIKYWRTLAIKQKLEVLWFAFKMFTFAIIFERYLLKEYLKLLKIRKKIKIYKKLNY
ncbi:MAG: glycosyltransferase family 2 protein [Patescibacteria group bacterium]|nr:glycosyltransferase family 2 protein [Patescibacteria group bacterium]